METNAARDQDYELWVLLQQSCDAMTRARENEVREFGISAMQAAALFCIKGIEGPATPAEISRWLFREPHTVSGLLQRMENQGLVKKVKDLERKNMIRIIITEKGEKAYQQSKKLKVIRTVLSSLSAEQKDIIRPYLETLRNMALQELGLKYKLPFP